MSQRKSRRTSGKSAPSMRGCACGCDNTMSLTSGTLSRRRFVAGAAALAATGLGTGFGASRALAQAANEKPYRIDVHHHLSPPGYIQAVIENHLGSPPQIKWTPEKSLADMDAAGVQVSMLSVTQPGVNFTSGETARKLCRESNEYAAKLIADHPGRTVFSQDANALAVLYDVVPKADQVAVLERAWPPGPTVPDGLLPGSYYFGFYTARAYDHAGHADRYLDFLGPWRGLLKRNFTTWPELRDPTRSDSHAWSGHPTADLLGIVAGIGPASPGFATVRIAPHLGALTSLDAAMPHPKGLIQAHYVTHGGELKATLTLPSGLYGNFQWKGKNIPLHQGLNEITVKQ